MRPLLPLLRGCGLFVLAVWLLGGIPALAQEDATPTPGSTEPTGYPITVYLCDTDPGGWSPYSGREIGGRCEPSSGIRFDVTAEIDPTFSASCTTGDDGSCYIEGAPYCTNMDPGTLTIAEDVSTLPAVYAPRENPVTGGNCTEFAGTTFINIVMSANSTDEATATTETLTAGAEGSTATIYLGDCNQDEFSDPVAQLNPVATPEGDAVGVTDVPDVETSFSTVQLSLDDLLGDDHVLVVFDQDDATLPLACGVIGGVVTEDGALAFGLPRVGDSRYSGVTFLSPEEDGTTVSIFLAENLTADPTPAP